MKKIFLISIFALLLVGCTELKTKFQAAPESSDCKSSLSKWLRDCTNTIAENQSSEIHMFNSIGSNDAMFIPKDDPAEEIFQKCQSIQPLPANDAPVYKKCLEKCTLEMKSINQNSTREEVNKLLKQNSGIFSAQAAIYSHLVCDVLKVRVEFEFQKDENDRAKINENDKVKAVSMPYLGLFTPD